MRGSRIFLSRGGGGGGGGGRGKGGMQVHLTQTSLTILFGGDKGGGASPQRFFRGI